MVNNSLRFFFDDNLTCYWEFISESIMNKINELINYRLEMKSRKKILEDC